MKWKDVWKVNPPRAELIVVFSVPLDYPFIGEIKGPDLLDECYFETDDGHLMRFTQLKLARCTNGDERIITHWCELPELCSDEKPVER